MTNTSLQSLLRVSPRCTAAMRDPFQPALVQIHGWRRDDLGENGGEDMSARPRKVDRVKVEDVFT